MGKTYDYRIFVDCGAPSLYNRLSRKSKLPSGTMGTSFKERKFDDFSYVELPEYISYRKEYIEFISKYKKHISVYSNLDVINNPKLTWQNQKILEAEGISPIPVFHLGSDPKWLKRYLDKYEYIAIGGLVPNPTSVLIPILDRLFKEYLVDAQGFPRVKLHGFACTSLPLMLRYPWYSVDSATSRKSAVYGGILFPEKNKSGLKTLLVSSRDVPLKHRLSKGVLKEIDILAEPFSLNSDNLSESVINRTAWNHLMFLAQVEKYALKWPWSIFNKEEKGHHLLDVYFAGSLSKKETDAFWEFLKNVNIPDSEKCRLVSFFYKEEVKHTIEIHE